MSLKRLIGLSFGTAALLGVAIATAPAQADEIPDAHLLASSCYICHGHGGNAVGEHMDSIVKKALKEGGLLKEMQKFKNDKEATIMNRIAGGYSDAEIEAISKVIVESNSK